MARTATLLELRTAARQRADMLSGDFVTDEELTSYVNSSIAELYDLIIQAFENYYVNSQNVTLVSGTDTYSLPNDFYKVLGVDYLDSINSTNPVTLRAFNFSERNRNSFYGNGINSGFVDLQYHIQGNSIRFIPNPIQSGIAKVWYIPAAEKLEDDTDTFDGINGYEEFVIWDCAMKMLAKEESDTSVANLEKQRIIKRIAEAASNRDTGESWRTTDIYSNNGIEGWD